ncbi:MAG: type IX secretion system membrane protein PorP/SprF [Sphingobacteriales bacterium]|nr:MAG: type IX secretion system membrane protein PorP/SprF [Sphingobacteriales bacterium]
MKSLVVSIFIMLCMSPFVRGQSYHFSQFFTTPLLTNPANTGTTDGPYRLSSNFRAQGISGGSPYFTGYISADISPFKEKLNTGHKVGIGMYIMNDQSMNGALKTNTIGFSGAYNVGLDESQVHSLGLGFQGTYQQRRIDYSQLSFDAQFGGTSYNPSLPTGENFDAYKRNYFDLNTGLLYRMQAEKMSFFAGVSGYNVIRHKDNLLSDEYKMPTRYVVQAGAQVISGTTGTVYMSLTFMQQAKASASSLGAAYGLSLSETESHEIRFGAWYRLQDAVIPYIGYVKNGFQLGLTYDYTTSSKKTGAEVRNGYELTLMYTAPDKNALKRALPWY